MQGKQARRWGPVLVGVFGLVGYVILHRVRPSTAYGYVAGLAFACLITAVRTVLVLRKDTRDKLGDRQLAGDTDERDDVIGYRSGSWAGYIGMMTTLLMFLLVIGDVVAPELALLICAIAYVVALAGFQSYYDKHM